MALVFAAISVVAYVARAITGAASAIIFNALLLVLIAFEVAEGITVVDGLYQLALTEACASLVMALIFRRDLRYDRFARRVLLGLVPSTAAFSLRPAADRRRHSQASPIAGHRRRRTPACIDAWTVGGDGIASRSMGHAGGRRCRDSRRPIRHGHHQSSSW